MTDAEFLSKVALLRRLGWLAVLGGLILGALIFREARADSIANLLAGAGILCVAPALVYLVLLTLWHWKARYKGKHSSLWGGLLVIETSGWFKLVYLFRHIIPDARGSGRYARMTTPEPT